MKTRQPEVLGLFSAEFGNVTNLYHAIQSVADPGRAEGGGHYSQGRCAGCLF